MRLFTWIQTAFHVSDVINASTIIAWSKLTSRRPESLEIELTNEDYVRNPYCQLSKDLGTHEWVKDCPGLPRITEALWRKYRYKDTKFLNKNLQNYLKLKESKWKLASDELTFPTYLAKRYAPNVSPSSMVCDGLGMCRVGIRHSASGFAGANGTIRPRAAKTSVRIIPPMNKGQPCCSLNSFPVSTIHFTLGVRPLRTITGIYWKT